MFYNVRDILAQSTYTMYKYTYSENILESFLNE